MMRGLREPRRAQLCGRTSAAQLTFAFLLFLLPSIVSISAAQDSRPIKTARNDPSQVIQLGEQINQNTIALMTGNINATYLSIGYDLSAVLDDGDNLRILPVIGKGGGQNIRDVRFLKGIDLGITQSNLLNAYRRSGEIGNIDDKIVYITKLYNEEMHLVVRADSGINSIDQLDGKRVNFSDIGSGTQLSTRDIFQRLGIKPVEVNMGQGDAAEALKRGEIAASILIAGKPTGSTSKLKTSEGFRLLPVPYPKELQSDYLPATLSHDDYPNLVKEGEAIDTIAVGAVLIAYNWPKDTDRYRRIAKFVEAFFPRLAEFQKPPRHSKWRETNLSATLPGWTRFPAAEEWLAKNRPQQQTAAADTERTQFNEFVSARGGDTAIAKAGSPDERERLYRDFLIWKQARDRH
ncbi:MAG TPA: TAXI family TRAP transporter solute-binding subunit [Xanthobacteraceae bacterium]|nr:TAXI family TRAP transporter solute-binding subunit [Xanthobacteraceae bacterium]